MSAAASAGRLAYRKDIEGLRAVAVLPVVAFHAGIHMVRGGFIGVDVFFVISGFLITQLLYRDIQADRYSILAFYERRVRRIFPALLAVLAVVFVVGVRYCLPAELVDLSKSLVAAALSASNVYFWAVSGYFDGPASSKPLLHTWSLAVEEQFYLVWPLFLLAGKRFFHSRLLFATAVVAAVSLALSIIGAFFFQSATFYLPLTRMWELALGGILALGALPAPLAGAVRNGLAALGLALIVASSFLINSDMPFPGALALPPCLGAALVILANRDGPTLTGRLLSLPPIAFVGLISYSLYLWHWPIAVFQRNYAFMASGLPESANKLLIIGVSLLMAVLSWRLIEQPFRTGRHRPSAPVLGRMAAAATACVLLLGISAWAAGGFPARYTKQELAVAGYMGYDPHENWRVGRCFLDGKSSWKFAPECLATAADRKNYLLLGDSHAAQLWSGLRSTYPQVNFLEATAADCFPTIVHSLSEAPRCSRVMDGVLLEFVPHAPLDRVVLIARWKSGLLGNVAATLEWLKQRHIPVTLVGPSAVFDAPLPRLLVNAMRSSDPDLLQHHLNAEMPALDLEMAQLARAHGVPYVSLITQQCPQGPQSCSVRDAGGWPLISDREHFTGEGSALMARRLGPQLQLPP